MLIASAGKESSLRIASNFWRLPDAAVAALDPCGLGGVSRINDFERLQGIPKVLHSHRFQTCFSYLNSIGVATRLVGFALSEPVGNGPLSFHGVSFLVRITSGVCGIFWVASMSAVHLPSWCSRTQRRRTCFSTSVCRSYGARRDCRTSFHSCCRPWLGTQTMAPSGPVTQFHMFEDTIPRKICSAKKKGH